MLRVIRTVGRKPILSLSLLVDLVCAAGGLVMGVYLLASLPPPLAQTHLKVIRDKCDALWWTMLAGGVLLILYRSAFSGSHGIICCNEKKHLLPYL